MKRSLMYFLKACVELDMYPCNYFRHSKPHSGTVQKDNRLFLHSRIAKMTLCGIDRATVTFIKVIEHALQLQHRMNDMGWLRFVSLNEHVFLFCPCVKM